MGTVKNRAIHLITEIPGPKSRALFFEAEKNVPRGVSHQTPIAIAYAEGATITDVDGNTYIDMAGGIGTLNVGHGRPEIIDAIKNQADKFLHTCFQVVVYEPYIRLAEKLNEITPGRFPKKTMLLNSGAEAVENGVKISKYHTRRFGVISFFEAFHGRTSLTMSLTGQNNPYKSNFGPSVPGIYHVPYAYCYRCAFNQSYPACDLACTRYIESIFESVTTADSVAAMIVEPVQGEGGFIVPPNDFLPELAKICKDKGIVYIDDEIQTGIGRTGKMFAVEHFGLEPDIILTAKSLGGGTVISGVTGKVEIMDAPNPGGLGTTFGGNPIACQASLATLRLFEKENLIERSAVIGRKMMSSLISMQKEYPSIGDVRGLGAMVAIEMVKDRKTKEPASKEAAVIREKCYKSGLITIGAGIHHNVIRFLMPLVITDNELDDALDVLDKVLFEASKI